MSNEKDKDNLRTELLLLLEGFTRIEDHPKIRQEIDAMSLAQLQYATNTLTKLEADIQQGDTEAIEKGPEIVNSVRNLIVQEYRKYASDIALQIEGASGYVNKMIFMDGAKINEDGTSDSLGFGTTRYLETIKDAEKMLAKVENNSGLSQEQKTSILSSINQSIARLNQDMQSLTEDFAHPKKLDERRIKFLKEDIITSLNMQDSNRKAISTEAKRSLLQNTDMLNISDELLHLVSQNPTIFTGNKSPIQSVLQPLISKFFKPDSWTDSNNIWTIDPNKLKDPILQKQFSEYANKNISAFIAIDTELANYTLDQETKTRIINGILASLTKGPELKEDEFVAEARKRTSNLIALQADATATLKLDAKQQQKIATSLLPALAKLPPLDPLDSSTLSNYIAEKLASHSTLASRIRTDTTKISKEELPTIIDKIVQKHKEISKVAEHRVLAIREQPTKIIDNAIGRSKLQLNNTEKKQIHDTLSTTLQTFHLDVTDKTGAGAKAVIAITDLLVSELAKSITIGSKVRSAIGIKDPGISPKTLEQITKNLVSGHETYLLNEHTSQEKERLLKEDSARWDKVGKTLHEINTAVTSSLTPPKPNQAPPPIKPTTASTPRQSQNIGRLSEERLSRFESHPISTLKTNMTQPKEITQQKHSSSVGFFERITSAFSQPLKKEEKPQPIKPQPPEFNREKFLSTLDEITKEANHKSQAKMKSTDKTRPHLKIGNGGSSIV